MNKLATSVLDIALLSLFLAFFVVPIAPPNAESQSCPNITASPRHQASPAFFSPAPPSIKAFGFCVVFFRRQRPAA